MKAKLSALFVLLLSQLALGNENASDFPLSGSYEYRFLGVYSIFKAELHIPQEYKEPLVSKSQPLDLLFTYYRSITSEQLIKQANRVLDDDPSSMERFSKELVQLNAAYRDVSEGDCYRLSFRPDVGTSLYLNGELLTTVEGNEFPGFYFSIWLGNSKESNKISKALWAGVTATQDNK